MYNVVELFSGIGSQIKAMKNLDMTIGMSYTCEWDLHAIIAYDAIHCTTEIPFELLMLNKDDLLKKLSAWTLSAEGKEAASDIVMRNLSPNVLRRLYGAILETHNYVDISNLKGESIPDNIDIMTYSFPCQDVSNVGAFHGYNKGIDKDSGSRSSLLWQVGRILEEMRDLGKTLPRFLLMENVTALMQGRHLKNFEMWISDLEKLGYVSKYYPLNAADFGLPQNRPRLLMISAFVGDDTEKKESVLHFLEQKTADDIIGEYQKSEFFRKMTIADLLRNDYSDPKQFEEACECTPNNTPSRMRIWEENPQLVLEGNRINPNYQIVRTITTKQDRNPNSGNLWFDSGIEGRAKFRYLTPRECMLFMGFTDNDYDLLQKRNPDIKAGSKLFSRDKIIRMAGNSIPVKLLEGVILQIKKLDEEVFS